MSVTQNDAIERSMLEGKDREQLVAIASALGVKTAARATKSTIIDKIIETTASPSGDGASAETSSGPPRPRSGGRAKPTKGSDPVVEQPTLEASLDFEVAPAAAAGTAPVAEPEAAAPSPAPAVPEVIVGADGEPLAEWEAELVRAGEAPVSTNGDAPVAAPAPQQHQRNDRPDRGPRPDRSDRGERSDRGPREPRPDRGSGGGQDRGPDRGGNDQDGGGPEGRRRRRRNRNRNNRGVEGPQGDDAEVFTSQPYEAAAVAPQPNQGGAGQVPAVSNEVVDIKGYLDLRDEGYGFLRVAGYLASKDDVYVGVKQTRQYGLRKGDFVTGTMRPAGRNEKNPALLTIDTINGKDPEALRSRPRFEDLTPLFPDEKLRLESPTDQNNMTARIVDLISPIGKGQRGLIVSPPKAGKTTIMKTIATSIERNHPEVKLIVLLIDERPEEVTDMRRTVKGEVIASTFDRPSDEHTHMAELTIEKAKRMVEMGQDVVIILDGITRLSRAYNLAAPASGRIMSGGIDAGALYPPKKFFGAARNIEEGGSLTILATALVETNSRMDDAIFEEFKGTGNMELRLDRKLAERRIYPAIDVDASSTRHEELLFDRKQLQMVWKLRRVLSGLAADGGAAPGLELLMDRLRTFRTNDEFLNEIAKQPSM